MSKTPRTDKNFWAAERWENDTSFVVDADFSRQLETELNAANAEIERTKKLYKDALEITMAECNRLRVHAGELEKDKARFDWLENMGGAWPVYYDGWHTKYGTHNSFRDAVDAIMKGQS